MEPKILFILHLPPPVHGAAVVGDTIRRSAAVNSAFDTRFLNLSTSLTVDDIGKGGIAKLFRYARLVCKSFFTALVFRPKLVYMTLTSGGAGFYKDALIVLLLKLAGKKFVFHFHNKGVSRHQHKRFDNWLYKTVFRNSSVILLSPQLRTDVEKYVADQHIFYCPNGIAGPDLVPARAENPVPRLLFIGNLTETKGILVLLDALSALKHKNVRFYCDIVGGEGAMSAQQLEEKIDASELSGSVLYHGKVFGAAKERLLANADVLVHPSLEECFPLVILEAMSFGLPVISTFEGGIPDIVSDGITGILVPRNDAAALAQAIEQVINDDALRAGMGKAGKQKFLERFTIGAFEAHFTQVLKDITDAR